MPMVKLDVLYGLCQPAWTKSSNPRSAAWNVELDRQLLDHLVVRVGYQQRNTSRDFVIAPRTAAEDAVLELSNGGFSSYRELQVTGRYQIGRHLLNASYVHSKAFGDLNDFNQFFGNTQQVVIQPDQRGRLPFDAPNRFLFWGDFAAPYQITLSPVIDVHTGFPPFGRETRSANTSDRATPSAFRRSLPSICRCKKRIKLPHIDKHAQVGFSVFNILNHFNPRDVQNDIDSNRFGDYFNGVGRTWPRGKCVLEF